MNSFSHELLHNNQARENQASAEQHRLGTLNKGNSQPIYKALIANVGNTFVRVGISLQNRAE